jgi:hypothetical protein
MFENFSKGIMSVDMKALDFSGLLDKFAYRGLDPVEIHAYMYSVESDETTLYMDIATLLAWAAVRGTALSDKALSNTSDDGQKVMKGLMDKYGVVSNLKAGAGRSGLIVTLGRLMATYPSYIARGMAAGGKVVGSASKNLAVAYCTPSGASLIPRSETWLIKLHDEWSLNFNRIINPQGSEEQVIRYNRIALNSSVKDDTERSVLLEVFYQDYLKKIGVAGKDGNPITVTGDVVRKWLDKQRANNGGSAYSRSDFGSQKFDYAPMMRPSKPISSSAMVMDI